MTNDETLIFSTMDHCGTSKTTLSGLAERFLGMLYAAVKPQH
jgi:hypothetical protein